MKKINLPLTVVAAILFSACCSVNSFGQLGVAVGPKAGVSISTFRGSDLENIDKRTSWLGGVFLNAQFGSVFTLQPEALLTQRGAKFTRDNVRRNIVVNYFEVPVLAKIRLPISDIVFPHVLLGPDFFFRTKATYSSYNTDGGAAIVTSSSDVRKSDVGALVGAGIDIQTRESGLFFTIDGRYGFGFNNINRINNTVEVKNAGWSFALGVGFLLKRDFDD